LENQKLKLPLDENIRFGLSDLDDLLGILLGEGGCPWDKEQTLESLKKYLLEECYEAAEAIENNDMGNLCEELGDVLFQLVFISRLAENNSFSMGDVIDRVCRKMVSRHTHIFGDETITDSKAVEAVWEKNKKKEKEYKSLYDKLNSIPVGMPALMRAEKVLGKAQEKNADRDECINQAINYLESIRNGNNETNMEDIGNLLLSVTNISLQMQINAEFALTNALKTYINKFENIEDY